MKTKYIFNAFILLLLMNVSIVKLNAQEFNDDCFSYRVNPDGISVTLTGSVNYSSEGLNIPASVNYNGNNYIVTIIGDSAFYNDHNWQGSLTIPNSVKIIEYSAFSRSKLSGTLFIPQSVETLDSNPFDYSGIDSIVVDSNNVYYDSRDNCNAIIETSTNTLVTGCKSTTIPNTVTSIGGFAFHNCSDLYAITIPKGITSIGRAAFGYCNNLTSVFIPSTIDTISSAPFYGCSGLEQIIVDPDNSYYDSRNNCNALMRTSTNELIAGCKNTIIPNNTYSICYLAFYNCDSMVGSLIIPNSVKIIEDLAFMNCYHITDLKLSDSLYYIGDGAFFECSLISSCLSLPNTVSYIGSNAFRNCHALNGPVIFPNSLLTIGDDAFAGCYLITSLLIPSSVTSIGKAAFGSCSNIEEIVVDTANAVYDSRNNCNAIIETSTNELIAGCNNTITPYDVTSIGTSAFQRRSGLIDTIVIPNSIQTIKEMAFDGSSNWYNGRLVLPNSLLSIGDNAFDYCKGIDSIISRATTPPDLGAGVFYHHNNNYTLTVPCKSLDDYCNSSWSQYFTIIIEDCIGVDEIDENSVSLYPNPTSGTIKIEADNIQSVSIYNMLGEKVFENAVNGSSFNYDFSDNESGVYIIRIETPEGVATKKVTVK